MLKWNHHCLFTAFLLLLCSGCRLGNYASPDPNAAATASKYKTQELFYTQPTQLQTIALFSDGNGGSTNASNANVTVSAVPTSVLQTFSNPVYFVTQTDTTKSPMFIGFNQSSYLSTALDASGNISASTTSSAATLWSNPNCQTALQITQTGTLDRTTPGTATFSDGSTAAIAGHAKITFSYMRAISGDCSADLLSLANCYTTGSGCATGELSAAESLFDLYAKQSGIIDLTNTALVSKIIGLAYTVTFQ